jgi:mono/diheme cytochrome c family protein
MTDAQLETLLREGKHPTGREIYVMPSKQSQFLSAPDMAALIAYLRAIPATGALTPPPPANFEESVAARLPDDYSLFQDGSQPRNYHNSAEEVAYYAAHPLPEIGSTARLAQGRYVASVVCSSCHGAQLDGVGEPAGDIQGALSYDAVTFDRLLVESVMRDGSTAKEAWGFGHEAFPLTKSERAAAMEYVTALAKSRTE